MSFLQICVVTFAVLVSLPFIDGRSPTNTFLNVCERKWELIYAHDEYGNATFGSKKELRELAMRGNYIKANLYMPDHIFQLPADSVSKHGDELCYQSLKALANNGSHVDEVAPWLFFLVCTTGHVTESDVNNNNSVFRVAMDWYVKDISADPEPVYSNFVDGTPLKPSNILRLHEAARRMSLFAGMRDRPYTFPLHSVVLDPETQEVNGQNVLHLGQKYMKNFVTFANDPPYKWYSFWSNLGLRDNSRWSITGHNAYRHNSDNCALDWYADVCWRLVYINDGNGFEDYGKVDDLIGAIQKGHRVRVRYDDMAVEVSNMRVKDGVVAAQILHEASRVGGYGKDRYFIEADTKVKFSIVHTTGKVNSYEYLVGSPVRKPNPPVRRVIEWMVDTRPWRVVLKTADPPGQLLEGSVFDLKDAVMGGASIRLNVELDPLAGAFYTQANNIRADIMTDTIFAQALDHVSDMKSRVPNEYELQKSIFNWYLTISSEGPVRMTAWMFGSDIFRYDESAPEATITWFANL